jgi:hypothetical protein
LLFTYLTISAFFIRSFSPFKVLESKKKPYQIVVYFLTWMRSDIFSYNSSDRKKNCGLLLIFEWNVFFSVVENGILNVCVTILRCLADFPLLFEICHRKQAVLSAKRYFKKCIH